MNLEKIEQLRAKYEELDKEWERLDSQGTQGPKQAELALKMAAIEKQIQDIIDSK